MGFPDPGGYYWQPIVSGLNSPIGITNSGDGTGRLFVLEQEGLVRIIQGANLSSEVFLDIRDRVGSQGSEQGILGLAFHPRYEENGFFFVNYTNKNGDTVIARYSVLVDNPNQADSSSEIKLIQISQPYGNHNGGMVAFGSDGYLYLGLGDGGSAGDPQNNAQSLNTLLGKILRIDVDGGDPYAIPLDNPFVNTAQPEIWAFGLRNPWRFSFDQLTGDLYIGDVGQNQWEEINFVRAGELGGVNFGWNYFEGTHDYQGTAPENLAIMDPIVEYDHSLGCSVTGGIIYRGEELPEWQGIYLYGDYCTGRVWGLYEDIDEGWLSRLLFENVGAITSFGEDEAGEVYLCDQRGIIYQLTSK